MLTFLDKIVHTLEDTPLSVASWAMTFTAIVLVRLGLEHFFLEFPLYPTSHYFYHFTHEFLIFLATFLCAFFILRTLAGIETRKIVSFLTFGFLILWSVPISEAIISHGQGFWSFYAFDSLSGLLHRYFTFFGDKPYIGITYGVRFEIGLSLVFTTLYAFLKTRNVLKTIGVAILFYTVLFFLGSLASFVTIGLEGFTRGFLNIGENDIAALMLSPTSLYGFTLPDVRSALNVKMSLVFGVFDLLLVALFVFFYFRTYFWSLLKNARFPQLIYHGGLFLLGALLSYPYAGGYVAFDLFHILGLILLLAAAECSWLASVVVNDLHDAKIDAITNTFRPVPTGSIPIPTYRTLGVLFFAGAMLMALLVSTQAAILFLIYQALAWLYSAAPLRLKRFPIFATVLAASASLLIFFAGFIVFSPEKSLVGLPWQIPLFLFTAYALLLPIKDFKDIEGDRVDGVYTLPVLLGADRAKRSLGAFLLVFFVASVFLLRVPKLFWLAFLFGSFAYWILQVSSPSHKTFPYRFLSGWYVALAFFFGLFLFLTLLKG